MTATPPSTQKPADPSPYSSLRSAVAADQPDTHRAPTAAPPASASGFSAELAKLQELREALWEAFKAGPDAGLPTILIELTNCYTNTLRFQMNMKSMNSRKSAAQPPHQQTASTKKQG